MPDESHQYSELYEGDEPHQGFQFHLIDKVNPTDDFSHGDKFRLCEEVILLLESYESDEFHLSNQFHQCDIFD